VIFILYCAQPRHELWQLSASLTKPYRVWVSNFNTNRKLIHSSYCFMQLADYPPQLVARHKLLHSGTLFTLNRIASRHFFLSAQQLEQSQALQFTAHIYDTPHSHCIQSWFHCHVLGANPVRNCEKKTLISRRQLGSLHRNSELVGTKP